MIIILSQKKRKLKSNCMIARFYIIYYILKKGRVRAAARNSLGMTLLPLWVVGGGGGGGGGVGGGEGRGYNLLGVTNLMLKTTAVKCLTRVSANGNRTVHCIQPTSSNRTLFNVDTILHVIIQLTTFSL